MKIKSFDPTSQFINKIVDKLRTILFPYLFKKKYLINEYLLISILI